MTVTLIAEPGRLTIRRGRTVPVWTYNGTVPGPALRVTQGDRLRVTLVNRLPQPTTIHWHGLIAPNSTDGVAGVTQDAVRPRQRYTYDVIAAAPGTYWYLAHQEADQQVAKGLYGELIVLPRDQAVPPAPMAPLPPSLRPLPGRNRHGRLSDLHHQRACLS